MARGAAKGTMAITDKAAAKTGRHLPAQEIALSDVAFDAPWDWLASGWRDFWAAPVVSFSYGVLFAGLAAFLSVGLIRCGWVVAHSTAQRRVSVDRPGPRRGPL